MRQLFNFLLSIALLIGISNCSTKPTSQRDTEFIPYDTSNIYNEQFAGNYFMDCEMSYDKNCALVYLLSENGQAIQMRVEQYEDESIGHYNDLKGVWSASEKQITIVFDIEDSEYNFTQKFNLRSGIFVDEQDRNMRLKKINNTSLEDGWETVLSAYLLKYKHDELDNKRLMVVNDSLFRDLRTNHPSTCEIDSLSFKFTYSLQEFLAESDNSLLIRDINIEDIVRLKDHYILIFNLYSKHDYWGKIQMSEEIAHNLISALEMPTGYFYDCAVIIKVNNIMPFTERNIELKPFTEYSEDALLDRRNPITKEDFEASISINSDYYDSKGYWIQGKLLDFCILKRLK